MGCDIYPNVRVYPQQWTDFHEVWADVQSCEADSYRVCACDEPAYPEGSTGKTRWADDAFDWNLKATLIETAADMSETKLASLRQQPGDPHGTLGAAANTNEHLVAYRAKANIYRRLARYCETATGHHAGPVERDAQNARACRRLAVWYDQRAKWHTERATVSLVDA